MGFVPFLYFTHESISKTCDKGITNTYTALGTQILGFANFRYQDWQEFKYAIKWPFCSFYKAPYKSILVGVESDTIW